MATQYEFTLSRKMFFSRKREKKIGFLTLLRTWNAKKLKKIGRKFYFFISNFIRMTQNGNIVHFDDFFNKILNTKRYQLNDTLKDLEGTKNLKS